MTREISQIHVRPRLLNPEAARLAVFLELAPALATGIIAVEDLTFILLPRLLQPEPANEPVIVSAIVVFAVSCFGGIGWMIAGRDAVAWLAATLRIMAMFTAFVAILSGALVQ